MTTDNPTKKPRILIPLTIQFSVRYVVRTGLLKKIQAYAEPIIVLGWEDPAFTTELRESGVEVYQNPGKKMGVNYYRTRNKVNLWHYDHMASPSTEIDRRRNALASGRLRSARNLIRDSLFRIEAGLPGGIEKLKKREYGLFRSDTNYHEYLRLVQRIQPDMVFCVTPYFFEEELLIRVAQDVGTPICAAILSFDNITTKGWMPTIFDEYLLWNQYNKDELARIYPESRQKSVKIVGAPQFDFYYDPKYLWSEAVWRQELGLPMERPVILFGSTGKAVAPHEEQWLLDIDRAIENGAIRGRPLILLRSHPVDSFTRWEPLRKVTHHVVYDIPWTLGKEVNGKTNITDWDIQKLVSTLKHSAVHVNASSTMTIDGAIFDRPQVGPAFDNTSPAYNRCARELYMREHYLPITRSGGLNIAYSVTELIQMINDALCQLEKQALAREKMVREIATLNYGKATERVNDAIKLFIDRLKENKPQPD